MTLLVLEMDRHSIVVALDFPEMGLVEEASVVRQILSVASATTTSSRLTVMRNVMDLVSTRLRTAK
jgi:hypothetical protein